MSNSEEKIIPMPSVEELAKKRPLNFPSQPGIIAEEKIAPQIGTDPQHMIETNEYDDRIFSNLNDLEILAHSLIETIPAKSGGRAYQKFAYMHRKLKRSKSGWNMNSVLRALAFIRGVEPRDEVARKPNVIARNLWDRSWRAKAMEDGKVPEE